ncbi:hypothetical protein [Anabaena lutea]|uniref:Uncharacterized protein n=1 Tax=Anabaena lutea FACHB-196 TaxID=2692881 RepID=A0ABR8FIG5_9NOST|nr:hypothetical protein [Anabaena lutea]MBD2569748.1 hypothetical protein [Anabaena lutea FACHB-196]
MIKFHFKIDTNGQTRGRGEEETRGRGEEETRGHGDGEMGRWGDGEMGRSHKGRFLILSVKAGLGRQGGKVDKEDFIRTMVF